LYVSEIKVVNWTGHFLNWWRQCQELYQTIEATDVVPHSLVEKVKPVGTRYFYCIDSEMNVKL